MATWYQILGGVWFVAFFVNALIFSLTFMFGIYEWLGIKGPLYPWQVVILWIVLVASGPIFWLVLIGRYFIYDGIRWLFRNEPL